MRTRPVLTSPVGSILICSAISLLAAVGGLLASPGTAGAQDIRAPSTLQMAVAQDVPLGEPALLVAKLTSGNGPVEGAEVRFFSPAMLGGVSGEMEIGFSATDSRGIAEYVYRPTIQGTSEVTARFFGNDRIQPSQGSARFSVSGVAQLYQPDAGVTLPVLGGWTIATVLLGVWAVYFTALVVVSRISRLAAGPGAGRSP